MINYQLVLDTLQLAEEGDENQAVLRAARAVICASNLDPGNYPCLVHGWESLPEPVTLVSLEEALDALLGALGCAL